MADVSQSSARRVCRQAPRRGPTASRVDVSLLLNDPTIVPFGQVDQLALAITVSAAGQEHCGFVCRLDTDDPLWVHLKWHHRLRSEAPSNDCFWSNIGSLLAEERRFFGVLVRSIAARNEPIPYALSCEGLTFDQDGSLTGITPGRGFTCSTFVVAVFASHGIDLVNEATWPEGANEDFQNWVVETLKDPRSGATAEHIAGVEGQVGGRRVRPSEVLGAACDENIPLSYADASAAAAQILEEVEALKRARAA